MYIDCNTLLYVEIVSGLRPMALSAGADEGRRDRRAARRLPGHRHKRRRIAGI